jgi:hypothetical protein
MKCELQVSGCNGWIPFIKMLNTRKRIGLVTSSLSDMLNVKFYGTSK